MLEGEMSHVTKLLDRGLIDSLTVTMGLHLVSRTAAGVTG
jgi:hypothetical protein